MLWVAENNTDPLFYLAVASLGPIFMTFVFFVSLNLWNSYSLYIYTKNQITWYQLNASNKWALAYRAYMLLQEQIPQLSYRPVLSFLFNNFGTNKKLN